MSPTARSIARAAAVSCFVLSGLVGLSATSRVAAATAPAGLPSHFAFGLAGHPDSSGIYGWMPDSGIPWDYAYQYLSGGVNTGSGWETWNTSGQFALYYAQGAAASHYIPVFSYYEMLQSNGSCGSCAEPQKDLSNLNNASTMSSYFQNFALLMQRLGSGTYGGITGFGGIAIVHVEPDLSGYAEQAVLNNANCYGYCTAQGNNPAYLKAAVASSGYAPVAGYANTYQGFNDALLHLRDLYAPNVRLAFHVSTWATGQDVGSSTDPSLDANALGQEAGAFAAASGVTTAPAGTSTYDLIFNDVGDRDAGYYKYVYGDSTAFWDRTNTVFPNFHRWESFVHAINTTTSKPLMIWQVPEGNQYFDTENNTNGHYQDNRAEYFFGHVAELAQNGIIGVLFGAGNGGSTVNNDGNGDGVTNPASFCTTDGMGSGQICNTHTSTVSDDDGGYLRMQGQQYYAGGAYPLGGATPTPTNTPVQPTSTSVPLTSTPTHTPRPPTATPTHTPMTATSTPTHTATPSPTKTQSPVPTVGTAPTATPTSTNTSTPIPPTATPTSSPTEVPPTPTATSTPIPPTTVLPTVTRVVPSPTPTPKHHKRTHALPSGVVALSALSSSPLKTHVGAHVVLSAQVEAGSRFSNLRIHYTTYRAVRKHYIKVAAYVRSVLTLGAHRRQRLSHSWTAPSIAGTYHITISVSNAHGTKTYAAHTYTIVVRKR